MITCTRCFTILTLGAILCGSSSFAATFQLVGSDPTPIPITGPTFSFSANSLGGGVFEFQNATGGVVTSLTFQAEIPNPGCSPAPAFILNGVTVSGITKTGFSSAVTTGCPLSASDRFVLNIFGTALQNQTGVFTVDLNDNSETDDPNGSGGWHGAMFTNTVTITASPVPEPATYGLIGAGLAALAIIRRRRAT